MTGLAPESGHVGVKKSLNDRPEGTLLPPIGVPVDLDLNRQRLAVYFRPVPAKLWVDSVTADAAEGQEGDANDIRLVGGRWPTDRLPWKLSNDDAMLYVDSGELELLLDPESAGGDQLPIGVATAPDGRRYLRAEGKDLTGCTGSRHARPDAGSQE